MNKVRLFTILFCFLASLNPGYGQAPCNWFSGPVPEDSILEAHRLSFEVKKIPAGINGPVIDGEKDRIWTAVKKLPIKRLRDGYTLTNPGYRASIKMMYDNEWLYFMVEVMDDQEPDTTGGIYEQDRIEIGFQNTFGGKGTPAEHCNDTNWYKWYWEQDGDKHFKLPSNPSSTNLVYLDQDTDDNCDVRPSNCADLTGDSWMDMEALNQLKFKSSVQNHKIVYEVALHLVNFLQYSATPDTGQCFGWDIAVKNHNGHDLVSQINFNDLNWNFWAYTPALAKAKFGTEFGRPYPAGFNVFDYHSLKSIENAKISVEGYPEALSDTNGLAIVDSVFAQKKHACTIEAEGYLDYHDSIYLQQADTLHIGLNKAYSPHFIIIDSITKESVEQADITLSGYTSKLTNADGRTNFHQIPRQSDIPFSVYHKNYKTFNGHASIVDNNDTLTIVLTPIYDIAFQIFDSASFEPIENATVQMAGFGSRITDTEGKTTFKNVPLTKDIIFSVTANNYIAFADTIHNVNQHLSNNIGLVPGNSSYSVSFTIKNENNIPVKDATISFFQKQFSTDSKGNVLYVGIPKGNHSYSVQKEGYLLKRGFVEIDSASKDLSIKLEYGFFAEISTPHPTEICQGDSAILYARYGESLSYQWRKNRENIPGATRSFFVAKNTGDYSVKVTHNNSGAFQYSNMIHITASTSDFDISFMASKINFNSPPFLINFTNLTDNYSIFDFTWHFGNGDVSDRTHATYQYPYNGVYDVTLVARDKIRGCTDEFKRENYISLTGGEACNINNSLVLSGENGICEGDSVFLQIADTGAAVVKWLYNNKPVNIGIDPGIWIKDPGTYYALLEKGSCSMFSKQVEITKYQQVKPKIIAKPKLDNCISDSIQAMINYEFTDYLWSDGQTSSWIQNNTKTTYTITVTDIFGCKQVTPQITLNASIVEVPEICLVTVDNETMKNQVVWQKPICQNIQSYNIYKEINNRYEAIGTLPYAEMSYFTDENAKPAETPARYKISAIDTCGNETVLSPFHQTMHLSADFDGGLANLNWTAYKVESEDFQPKWYVVRAGYEGENMIMADKVEFSAISDAHSLSVNVIKNNYVVEIGFDAPCLASENKKAGVAFESTYSNLVKYMGYDPSDIEKTKNDLLIYPNPANDKIFVHPGNATLKESSITIVAVDGKIVYKNTYKQGQSIDIQYLNSGLYILLLNFDNALFTTRFIKN